MGKATPMKFAVGDVVNIHGYFFLVLKLGKSGAQTNVGRDKIPLQLGPVWGYCSPLPDDCRAAGGHCSDDRHYTRHELAIKDSVASIHHAAYNMRALRSQTLSGPSYLLAKIQLNEDGKGIPRVSQLSPRAVWLKRETLEKYDVVAPDNYLPTRYGDRMAVLSRGTHAQSDAIDLALDNHWDALGHVLIEHLNFDPEHIRVCRHRMRVDLDNAASKQFSTPELIDTAATAGIRLLAGRGSSLYASSGASYSADDKAIDTVGALIMAYCKQKDPARVALAERALQGLKAATIESASTSEEVTAAIKSWTEHTSLISLYCEVVL